MVEEITLRMKLKTWIEANFTLQENKDLWFITRKNEVIVLKVQEEKKEVIKDE
jgi:hypothetical protein